MYYTREEKLQIAGVTALILAGCLLIGFLLYPHTITGKVADVYWQSYIEIEEYRQVYVKDSRSRPPSDAYNVDRDYECYTTTHYNPTTKQTEFDQDCHYEYSWTMDRWVVVSKSIRSGQDYAPTYNEDFKLVESNTYGAQREGRRYVYHFIQGQFDTSFKTCKVSEKLWRKTEVGGTINTTRLGHSYTLCRFK